MTETALQPNWFKRRRAEKLRRELALLEHMDTRLWRKIVVCALATIAALAAVFFGIGYAFHIHLGLLPALTICAVNGALLYWASRYEYGLAGLFTAILLGVFIAVIFEDLSVDTLNLDAPLDLEKKSDRKAERRAKIQQAVKRRRLRLEKLLGELK